MNAICAEGTGAMGATTNDFAQKRQKQRIMNKKHHQIFPNPLTSRGKQFTMILLLYPTFLCRKSALWGRVGEYQL
jgi:hypothetical protein